MKIIETLKFKKEKVFAAELAEQLARDVSPELMQKRRKALSVNKITRLLEKTYTKAQTFQQENSMGFFRRSIFVNAFQWELKSRNYPEDFSTMATEGLVISLMKKPTQ
ncbi:hypothetical protein [Rhodoferax saidenbachensis]|uniref:Uncharacterized protein n=1 Tax=Rhodoferax saidenbachensis TaxID=1484693 RepID=A0A1P8KEL8_9BURK|nr:hypothetical protein [Rhodoferax saidenbachensis]APW44480.1 hypothetical protein RS694_19460 [Rhodoferax saidenbachensis]